jgi:hypothetical protein
MSSTPVQFIAHRINTIEQLQRVPPQFGTEVDLRDRGERLILQHDPFKDGEDFSAFLRHYRHDTMVLNIKSEGIEPRVLEEIRRADTVRDFFFLDCSFPMMQRLIRMGEHRIAARFSEYEPLTQALALAGKVQWVWIDCFTRLPLDYQVNVALSRHFKMCIVSPELQGHPTERIEEFARQLETCPVQAICTKRPDLWQFALREEASV